MLRNSSSIREMLEQCYFAGECYFVSHILALDISPFFAP